MFCQRQLREMIIFFIRQVMMVLKLASEPVMAVSNNSAHGLKQSLHQNYFD